MNVAGIPTGLDGVELECLASDVGLIWFPVADRVIRPYIRRNGTWEPEEGRLLARLLRPGARFVDVGANVGYFSKLAARCADGLHIECFEPHPVLARILELNLWQERVDSRVWPVAAGSGARIAALETPPTNPGDTRSAMSGLEGTRTQLLAPAITLDEALAGATVDVVKIDVQGAEPEVLRGMEETIARSRSVAIVMEFWPRLIREGDREPLDLLDEYRRYGLRVVTCIGNQLNEIPGKEIVEICDSGGRTGAVNLLLVRA